jgi:hypothetical protein
MKCTGQTADHDCNAQDMFRAIFAIEATVDHGDGKTLLVTPPPSLEIYPSLAETIVTPNLEKGEADGGLGSDGLPEGAKENLIKLHPLKSHLTAQNMFTIGVIPNAQRRTIAKWVVDEPHDVLQLLEKLSSVQ